MTLFLIILHLTAALGIVAGWRMGKLHLAPSLLPVVILLPLWGPVCAIVVEMHYLGGEKSDEEPGTGRFGITDEVYRSIRMEEAGVRDVLPIADVLAEGSPVQRRRLLLSVLHAGPKPFVRPLRIAGVNEDTEVVHYAVTALVELRSEYAQRTARIDALYRKRPADPEILLEYADLDEEYVKSGIPENNERTERLEHCRAMLEKLLSYCSWRDMNARTAGNAVRRGNSGKRTPREPSAGRGARAQQDDMRQAGVQYDRMREDALLPRFGEICLQLEDPSGAEEAALKLLRKKPDDETGYLLLLRAKILARDRKAISAVISEVKQREIYLSPAGRELLEFWAA